MITPEETRLLDRLALMNALHASTVSAGVRRARAHGSGLEFHEYRPYQPGDDPRSIDWTIEARLQQLVVRVSRGEGDARLHLLIDTSASMSIGIPDKLTCARRVAAALSYVAVERREGVAMAAVGNRVHQHVTAASGRPQLLRVLSTLGVLRADGPSSLGQALMAYGSSARGPGLVAVLSDFFDEGDGREGLRFLQYRGLTPAVIQIVAPDEIDPRFSDDVELYDVENLAARPVVAGQDSIARYQQRLGDHAEQLRTFCMQQRFPWARLRCDAHFSAWLEALEQGGVFSAYA